MAFSIGGIRSPLAMSDFVNDAEHTVDDMSVSAAETHTFTSFFHNDGKLGAASYNEETFELFVFNDTSESTSTFECMLAIIETTKPQSIVYGANNEETIGKYLRRMFRIALTREGQQLPALYRQDDADLNDVNDNIDQQNLQSSTATQMSNAMLCVPCDVNIPFDCRYRAELVTMTARDFGYQTAIERIQNIRFNDVDNDLPDNLTDEQRLAALYTYVDFQSRCCVRAIGGLLRYLDRSRIGILPFGDDNDSNAVINNTAAAVSHQQQNRLERFDGIHCVVRKIVPLDVQDLVFVTPQTIDSLRVFYTEPSGSVYKRMSGWREGLSLFSLCNRTVSTAGRQLLHLWFRRPTRNHIVLLDRQRAIQFLVSHRQSDITAYLLDRLRGVGNVRAILGRMAKGEPPTSDWHEYYTTLFNALSLCEICANSMVYPRDISIFGRLAAAPGHASLVHLLKSLNDAVDLAVSHKTGKFTVRAGVDAELDAERRTYEQLPSLLDAEANRELHSLDLRVPRCGMIYMPQLGFLLQLPASIPPEADEAMSSFLTFVFENDGQRYYKSPTTNRLNLQYGDLKVSLNNRELFYQFRLQQLVVKNATRLAALLRMCAELDCLISLAITAQMYGYVRPNLSSDGLLEVVDGRHPLQEMCTRDFVPNSIESGGITDMSPQTRPEPEQHLNRANNNKYSRIKLLTGPNMSGKSVYMKQIGLIVYMAHVGSFVPAHAATIPFCDRIITQIRHVESAHVPLSAFALDAMSVNIALRFATRHSLVLLDEFGRGTLVRDGEALLAATLNHWTRAGSSPAGQCPHVIVSTHFGPGLHSMLNKSSLIECMTFETRMINNNNNNIVNNPPLDTKIIQTHKLMKGRTDYNYALLVAQNELSDRDVVARAKQIMHAFEDGRPIEPIAMPLVDAYTNLCKQVMHRLFELDLNDADKRGVMPVATVDAGNEAEQQQNLFQIEAAANVRDDQQRQRARNACCEEIYKLIQASDAIRITRLKKTITAESESVATEVNVAAEECATTNNNISQQHNQPVWAKPVEFATPTGSDFGATNNSNKDRQQDVQQLHCNEVNALF